jgi:hypothetical protein
MLLFWCFATFGALCPAAAKFAICERRCGRLGAQTDSVRIYRGAELATHTTPGRLALPRRHVFKKIIGRHVWAGFGRLATLHGPGAMTVQAKEFLRYKSKGGEQDNQVWENKLPRELRVIHPRRFALWTPHRVPQRTFRLIPGVNEVAGILIVLRSDSQFHSGQRMHDK